MVSSPVAPCEHQAPCTSQGVALLCLVRLLLQYQPTHPPVLKAWVRAQEGSHSSMRPITEAQGQESTFSFVIC